MIDRQSIDERSYVSNVSVTGVEKRTKQGPKHYVYVIQVTWANPTNEFIIYRRYREFFDLQCKLLDLYTKFVTPPNQFGTQSRQIPYLPGKIIFGRSQIRQIALERRHSLNIYCKSLIALPESISRSRFVLDFFRSRTTDVTSATTSVENQRKDLKISSDIISRPLNLPTYRCIEDFSAIEKCELSVRKNSNVQLVQKHTNGWWLVQVGDRTGFVPGAFLEPIESQNEPKPETLAISSYEPFVVNQSYRAMSGDEISLEQGSFVFVLEKSYTGWWKVKFHEKIGRFPAIYLTSCEGRPIPEIRTDASNHLSVTNVPDNRSHSPLAHQWFGRCETASDDEPEDETMLDNTNGNQVEIFYVHTNYVDDYGQCVPLERGETVEIHQQHESGWWLGRVINRNYNTLTWLPSAFLQREPITNTNYSTNDNHQIDVTEEPVQIYQNADSFISNHQTETFEEPAEIYQNSDSFISNRSQEEPTASTNQSGMISVRDLVKKFNRQ